ncbi:ExeA family protein [Rubinisphaera margarita]|uniref:ExeA family protein n=1 Tax=Rubinisphaera margarita TaxID=2909586 RepID=UPI001EE859F0|nr:AAA family ATPase [Rubinisphaera margarita]MCG6154259.1 AAA family ATPase [Rubinisphaera margarita]
MYETHFHLKGRPFTSVPDPRFAYFSESFVHALNTLDLTVRQGVGIGLMTGAAGTGKTLLCKTLAEKLADDPLPVLLLNASFPTRSSLLQAILFELKRPYRRMTEQELRLELVSHGRDLAMYRTGIALIVDEAHMLKEHILEELRSLTNFIYQSRSVFRVVLSGQPVLEEVLARRSLQAINHKLEAHVCLDELTQKESVEFILTRVQECGGELLEMFDEAALELIVYAADGNPRCLNQLCDHACMLAFEGKASRVSVTHVQRALSELQKLPLHWNIPPTTEVETLEQGVSDTIEIGGESDVQRQNLPTEAELEIESATSFEVGAPAEPVRREPVSQHSPQIPEAVEIDDDDLEALEIDLDDEPLDESTSDFELATLEMELRAEQEEQQVSKQPTVAEEASFEDEPVTAENVDEVECSLAHTRDVDQTTVSETSGLDCPFDKNWDIETEMAELEYDASFEAHAQIPLEESDDEDRFEISVIPVTEIEEDPEPFEAEAVFDRYALMDARRLGQLDQFERTITPAPTNKSRRCDDVEMEIANSVIGLCTEVGSGFYLDEDYVPRPDEVLGTPIDSATARHDPVDPDYGLDEDDLAGF